MKQKIIYMLAFICCISLLSSAKQASVGCIKKCDAAKAVAAKENPVKPKKTTGSGTARPFNFYLVNI